MAVIFGIIGAAIGASFDSWGVAVLGFVAGFLLRRAIELSGQQRALSTELDELRQRQANLEGELRKLTRDLAAAPLVPAPPRAAAADAAPPAARPAVPPVIPPPEPGVPVTAAPIPVEPPPVPVDVMAASEQKPLPPAPPPLSPGGPEAFERPLWVVEFFTTGNVVAKVGMVIVFFGVAFLVRYAADRGLLPIEYRLMSVAAGSLALLGVGWYLRRSQPEYAMVLQGGAVGVLYLTIFAAFRLYALLPASLTFALLLAIVALSAVLAVLQDAIALAVIGTSGGFLAPILASTGSGSHVALFSYYLVLNAGVVGIAWFRSWRFLNWLAFVFTFGIGFVWGSEFYQPALFSTTEPFLVIFFLMFLGVALLFAHRQRPELRGYIDGSLVFGTPALAFSMQSVLVRDIEFGRAYSALVLSALYLTLTRWLWRRDAALRPLAEAFLALGVTFLILAVPFAFDGHATATTWALEGAGLVWIGARQHRLLARVTGAGLLVAAGVAFAAMATTSSSSLPILNTRFLGGAAIAAASIVAGRVLWSARDSIHRFERVLEWVLLVWGMLWWLGSSFVEVDRHVPSQYEIAAQLMAFAASTAIFAVLGHVWQWRAMMLATIPLGPLMWLVVVPLFGFDASVGPQHDLGWLAWPIVIVVSYLVLFWFESAWPAGVRAGWHAGAAWLVMFLVTWAVAVEVRRLVPDSTTWSSTIWCVVPAMFVLALRAFGPALRWPVQRFATLYRSVIPVAPAVAMLLWVFWAFGQSGSPAPLPYVPILNPVELVQALGLIVAAVVFMSMRTSAEEIEGLRRGALALIAGFAFIAVNVLVARVVHFYWNVPFAVAELNESAVFQTGISILWGVTAGVLMALARMRVNRPAWMVGAALLGILIVKLFVVDLGNVGGVARIVSFLATGMLILVIGYFAPVPPKKAERLA